jgi:hypothetical protein
MTHKNRIPIDAKVRFTQERLSALMPQDRRQLEGRIGTVQGHWQGTKNPTVYFAQDSSRTQLRLLKIDPRHLELVTEISAPDVPQATAIDETGVDEKMSQEELDNLFG